MGMEIFRVKNKEEEIRVCQKKNNFVNVSCLYIC